MLNIVSITAELSALVLALFQFGGGFVSLFFGRRLTWFWVALAVYTMISRGLLVALYREDDFTRMMGAMVAGTVVAVAAAILARRFPKAVLATGGFLAGGLISIEALGPLLKPFPEWLVIGTLVALGIAGGGWAVRHPDSAGTVLSALVGAGLDGDVPDERDGPRRKRTFSGVCVVRPGRRQFPGLARVARALRHRTSGRGA